MRTFFFIHQKPSFKTLNFKEVMLSKSDDKISPTKWKSMEEESFTGNKSLAIHLQNLDKITVLSDANNKNIDSIDEESIHSQNLHNDDHLYGIV